MLKILGHPLIKSFSTFLEDYFIWHHCCLVIVHHLHGHQEGCVVELPVNKWMGIILLLAEKYSVIVKQIFYLPLFFLLFPIGGSFIYLIGSSN